MYGFPVLDLLIGKENANIFLLPRFSLKLFSTVLFCSFACNEI